MQMGGNPDGECGALAYLAPNGHLAAMNSGDVLDNRKPKSRTSIGSAARVIHSVETLEYPVDFSGRNAYPVVRDCDLDVVVIASGLHMSCYDDARSRVRVGDGILNEVSNRDLQLPSAAQYSCPADTRHSEGDAIPFGVHPAAVDGFSQDPIDLDDFRINQRVIRLESGKFDDLTDQISEPCRLDTHPTRKLANGGRVVCGLLHRFG